jgi:hypothetical protein
MKKWVESAAYSHLGAHKEVSKKIYEIFLKGSLSFFIGKRKLN